MQSLNLIPNKYLLGINYIQIALLLVHVTLFCYARLFSNPLTPDPSNLDHHYVMAELTRILSMQLWFISAAAEPEERGHDAAFSV